MNDERNAKIVKLWNSGLSAKQVALSLKVSPKTVEAVLHRKRASGAVLRSKSVIDEARNAKIVRLWNSGLNTGEVANHVGCTKNMVLATVVKHRALGDITRPMVESRGERGKLGIIARYGVRSHRKAARS